MDGLAIARERIAREAEQKSGFLDLGRLSLSRLPDELFALKDLQRLNLGHFYFDDSGRWHQSTATGAANHVEEEIGRLAALKNLRVLSLNSTAFADLAPLKGLPNLQSLDCSATQVSDLALLKGLPNLQSLSCWSTQVSDLAQYMGR